MPDDGFAVGVEYSVAGGRFQALPQHSLFVVSEDSGDDADQSKTVTYSGVSWVAWLLAHTYLHWSQYAKNGARLWTESGHPASPGTIMGGMILESKARGWGQQVAMDFAWDTDSNGVAWKADDKVLQEWRLLTPLTDVLSSLVKSGLCDWTVEGMKLRLFRPGTLGADRAELVLGGPSMEHIPVKTDASKIFTHLTVVPEKASYWLYLENAGAPSKWGRLEATMTQSGIDNHTEATKLAQPALLEGRTAKREEAFEWTPGQGDLAPWRDFQVGDTLTARVRGTQLPRRVIGIVAREQGESVTVRVIVGEKIGTLQSRILSRVGAGSVGGIIGGSGNSFPGSIGPSALAPDRPNALQVKTNTGEWGEDGSSRSTVALEWEPVTSAVDGSLVDVVEYEIWSRLPHELLSHVTTVTATSTPEAVISVWPSGVDRLVAVKAKSAQGVYSEFSLEVPVTPSSPAALVPKAPGVVTVAANTGAFTPAGPVAAVTLTIPAVTKSTDNEDIEIAEYELWDANGPLVRVPASPAKVTLPTGGTAVYRARACTPAGVWGDLSVASATVTGASPAVQSGKNPTGVTGRTGFGVVVCDWSGAFASAPAAHTLLNVQVQARVGTSGAWVMQGTMDRAGSVTLKLGEAGQTVQMQAVAYDRLGRVIGTSATVSVVVQGIELGDLDAGFQAELDALDTKATAAQTAAGEAQTTANTARTEATSKAAAAETAAKAHADAKSEAARLAAIAAASGDATAKADAAKAQAKADAAADATAKADAARAAAEAKAATAQARADAAFTNAANAATAAGQAQTSADGRSRVWYLATAPAGVGHKKDDVWFDTSQGMRMSYWNVTTSTWVLVQFGTQAIANLAITNALIANAAIDNAKIANVDAGKITTGFLAAARIAAMSITVAKLAIGSFNEIWPDPEWREPAYGGWTPTSRVGIQKAGTGSQHGTYVEWADMPVAEGERYLFSIKRTNVAGSGGEANVYVQALDANKALLNTVKTVSTLTPGTFTGERLVPAGAAYLRVGFYTEPNMGTGVTVRFSDLHIRQLQTGALIVDGAVKARHVEMETGFFDKLFGNTASIGRVRVDHLAPNVGDTLNIGGNAVAINLNSRVDGALVDLEQVRQDADAAQSSADAAGAVADAASQAVATLAAGRVLTAENALAALSGKIDTYENSFLFLPDGLHIRESTSAQAEMVLTSAGARLVADGVSVSEWNQGQMIVPQIVARSGQIANHIIDSSIAGHTTWRAIS